MTGSILEGTNAGISCSEFMLFCMFGTDEAGAYLQ
jgi:hypothetical protein